jgi:hypothetical protein
MFFYFLQFKWQAKIILFIYLTESSSDKFLELNFSEYSLRHFIKKYTTVIIGLTICQQLLIES